MTNGDKDKSGSKIWHFRGEVIFEWPLYKKDSRYEKSNYRSISVLSNLSKIFKNVLYDPEKLQSAKLPSSIDKKI